MEEKHITYIDGVRVLVGYTHEEYMTLLWREAQQQQRHWDAMREQEKRARDAKRKGK